MVLQILLSPLDGLSYNASHDNSVIWIANVLLEQHKSMQYDKGICLACVGICHAMHVWFPCILSVRGFVFLWIQLSLAVTILHSSDLRSLFYSLMIPREFVLRKGWYASTLTMHGTTIITNPDSGLMWSPESEPSQIKCFDIQVLKSWSICRSFSFMESSAHLNGLIKWVWRFKYLSVFLIYCNVIFILDSLGLANIFFPTNMFRPYLVNSNIYELNFREWGSKWKTREVSAKPLYEDDLGVFMKNYYLHAFAPSFGRPAILETANIIRILVWKLKKKTC